MAMYLLLSYGIISFVEHIIHRYFMHMKWLPAAVYRAYPFFNTTYEAHAVRHHGRWYKRFDYEPDPVGRFDNLTFKLSDSLAMLISTLPLWAPLIFFSPFGGCVFVASAFVHNRLWNALHRQMHIPEDVFFKDWKVYRFLARYHFMHHQMNGRNFNVVCPLADFVLCRTAKPRVRDIRNMLTLGLLYPRTIRMRSRVAGWSTRRFTTYVPMNVNSEVLPTADLERHILRTNNTLHSLQSSGRLNVVNSADEAVGEPLPPCNAQHNTSQPDRRNRVWTSRPDR
ncbi:MAG: hypothetical protein E8D49_10890 [Nitrospira sp.]|nr:MAG: hypothetical protein E8D49_10890 [Nitrospira sp.]